ncbi:MAG: YidC/Oxa1 family membrane protein insertase [Clostridiales Family XIII bacterium]|nr:YidC/Oxa1 family membrane protein insertase [Clostridiales Family XIII bacterium]
MKYIAVPLGMLLSGIYDVIGHYGYTIILFTLIVRGLLFPLYANQIKHSARMAEVQPKMQALQKQHANDRETLNRKMQELYREEKFNPMMGCLPMLIQLPIIWGLFSLLRNPTAYMPDTEMWIASHEAFYWISDLSQPDQWILPILAGISTFFSFRMTQQQQQATGEMANQMAPMMKMMKYIFPVMIVGMGRSFPAGLTIYWFVGTVVQIGQTQFLNMWKKRLIAKNEAGKKKK